MIQKGRASTNKKKRCVFISKYYTSNEYQKILHDGTFASKDMVNEKDFRHLERRMSAIHGKWERKSMVFTVRELSISNTNHLVYTFYMLYVVFDGEKCARNHVPCIYFDAMLEAIHCFYTLYTPRIQNQVMLRYYCRDDFFLRLPILIFYWMRL